MSDPASPEGPRTWTPRRLFAAAVDAATGRSARTPSVSVALPVDDTSGDKVPGWGSLGIVLAGYTAVFGVGVFNAFAIEFRGAIAADTDFSGFAGAQTVVYDLSIIALSIALLVLVSRYARRVPWSLAGFPQRGSRVWPTLMTAVVAIAALRFADQILASVEAAIGGSGQNTNPGVTGGGWALLTVFTDLRAGIQEEILIVAIPVLLLRRAGWSAAFVIGLSVALRWPFHVYHGFLPSLPWAIIWGGTFCALYLYLRRLTPLIVAHAANDFMIDSQAALGLITGIFTIVVGLMVLAWLAYRSLRQRVDELDTAVSRFPDSRVARLVSPMLWGGTGISFSMLFLFVYAATSIGVTTATVTFLAIPLVLAGGFAVFTASQAGWMAVNDRAELRKDPDEPCLLAWYTPRPGVITINHLINVDPFTAFRTVADHEPSAHTIRVFGVAEHAKRFAAAGHPLTRHPGDLSPSISMTRRSAAALS